MRFAFEQEYEIENLDSSAKDYPVSHFESCDWDWHPKFNSTTRISNLSIFLAGEPVERLDEQEAPFTSLGAGFVKVERAVNVPLDTTLRVKVGSTKIMRDRHLETRMIGEPSMALGIEVRHPPDLEVEIELPHKVLAGQEFRPQSDTLLRDGRRKAYWNVGRPLAPLTFFNIVWRKVQQPIAAQDHPPAPAPAAVPAPLAAPAPATAPAPAAPAPAEPETK